MSRKSIKGFPIIELNWVDRLSIGRNIPIGYRVQLGELRKAGFLLNESLLVFFAEERIS